MKRIAILILWVAGSIHLLHAVTPHHHHVQFSENTETTLHQFAYDHSDWNLALRHIHAAGSGKEIVASHSRTVSFQNTVQDLIFPPGISAGIIPAVFILTDVDIFIQTKKLLLPSIYIGSTLIYRGPPSLSCQ